MITSSAPAFFPLNELVWFIFLLTHFGLALLAILSLARFAPGLSAIRCARWTLFIVVVPYLGGALWFRIGKPRAATEATPDRAREAAPKQSP